MGEVMTEAPAEVGEPSGEVMPLPPAPLPLSNPLPPLPGLVIPLPPGAGLLAASRLTMRVRDTMFSRDLSTSPTISFCVGVDG